MNNNTKKETNKIYEGFLEDKKENNATIINFIWKWTRVEIEGTIYGEAEIIVNQKKRTMQVEMVTIKALEVIGIKEGQAVKMNVHKNGISAILFINDENKLDAIYF